MGKVNMFHFLGLTEKKFLCVLVADVTQFEQKLPGRHHCSPYFSSGDQCSILYCTFEYDCCPFGSFPWPPRVMFGNWQIFTASLPESEHKLFHTCWSSTC
ncbi:hypothetical protein E2C01_045730 [Portunus trituberculatus]|uniref:Uncharacterized protein n=1 Tax=Portunus trituberculatus TaxID=210409 RepID=A0A5B7G5T4_PORTR|nr:hypothetical protein [Portunus trituberculatus]